MKRTAFLSFIALLFIVFTVRGQKASEMRLDRWTESDLTRKNVAAKAIIDAYTAQKQVDAQIEKEHGIIPPDEAHPCAPFDVVGSSNGDQFIITHFVPIPNPDGRCERESSDEGVFSRGRSYLMN